MDDVCPYASKKIGSNSIIRDSLSVYTVFKTTDNQTKAQQGQILSSGAQPRHIVAHVCIFGHNETVAWQDVVTPTYILGERASIALRCKHLLFAVVSGVNYPS